MDEHDDLFYYWKMHNMYNINLVHLDPHCDLYGAFINVSENYMVETKKVLIDEGTFLTFAIKESIVKKLKWVYDEYGGRKYDDTTVIFEYDLTGRMQLLKTFFKKQMRYPIEFSVRDYKKWKGPMEGEHLSIDWDSFALNMKDKKNIITEYQEFISRKWDVVPEYTYICYSQEHVHSSVILFLKFVEELRKKFDAEIDYFFPDKPHHVPHRSSFFSRNLRRSWNPIRIKSTLWLHQHGIF